MGNGTTKSDNGSAGSPQAGKEKGGIKAAVLCGGIGEERQISLESGRCVRDALIQGGVEAILADIWPEKLTILDDRSIDVFFIAMHGRFGEDGQLQEIMEGKGLIYTGNPPEACRVAFDKMLSKKVFERAGVKTPPSIEFKEGGDSKELEVLLAALGNKFVVKPFRQGSSFGVSIVDNVKETAIVATKTAKLFGDCMIEKYIPGRELTVGIVCGQVLPIIEIRPKEAFYNFQAKYVDEKTQFLFDTIEDKLLEQNIKEAAMKCFEAVGIRNIGRADLILGSDRELYALEVNAIPGLTGHSLVPMAAAKAGLNMSRLCTMLIEEAMKRRKVKVSSAGLL
jgi:D-alanine-D-alanine ligase